MSLRLLLISIFATLGLIACGAEPTTPAKTTATIEISDLYFVKPSNGRTMTGGGMQITAIGGDFRLVSVSSDGADRVELHTMEMENDMMKMRQVEGFDISDGTTLSLEPGGPHLMLFGVDDTLQIGDESEMLFTFEDAAGETVTLNYAAEVRSITDR